MAHTPAYRTEIDDTSQANWTVGHYDRPAQNVDAVQLELAFSTYLTDEARTGTYNAKRGGALRAHLGKMITLLKRPFDL
ncbi:hypothetical protein [Roseobacter sp.]|uniref:hypothetical protein n=1 Tax=Roseobacter sp. TaxID=1907202 RepID=UPI00329806AF